ncbi:9219_t:CDS:2 [Scutellospora calospora]|uniref:9219_t:CDS:1 n=1 Tax=Scutellospora calospora TaxID=85575 RepID=A0ACA9K1Y9_9GLOM|nr:9219_t:CDS:2 [Scutellospora calospora]
MNLYKLLISLLVLQIIFVVLFSNICLADSDEKNDGNKKENKNLSPNFDITKAKEISERLWLPEKHDLKISNFISHSWFNIKRSEQVSIKNVEIPIIPRYQEHIDSENDELKTKKIRIYPTKEEKQKLKSWIGTARWTYNQCLDSLDEIRNLKTKKEKIQYMRQKHIVASNYKNTELSWVIDTPSSVRDAAMMDLFKNIKSNHARKIARFTLKKQKKKDKNQSITIEHLWFNKSKIFSFLRNIKTKEKIPEIKHAVNIIMNRLKYFYICIPIPTNINKHESINEDVLTLDPGVRTFMTGYDTKGNISEFGNKDIDKIQIRCLRYDKLQSCLNQESDKGLSLQDSEISMSELSDCVTARNMLTWSHYKFKMFLRHKIREYLDMNLIECTEEYTSKTCTRCGMINKLGGSKNFTCGSCGLKIDRDHNEKRDSETIRKIIEDHVEKGSIVHTDRWKGYLGIENLGVTHKSVNYSKNFTDPITGVHTNMIEGLWNGIKLQIALRNRNKNLIKDHLLEFIWRRINKDKLWDAFIYALQSTAYYENK